jgi:GT2 family glycosyltransferase
VPSISVIVPVFDGVRYLPYFLASLAEATPSSAELIFVDDGSTEPVLDFVPDTLGGAPVTKIRHDQNRGYSAAVNRGFAAAHGDILIQLNSDLILDRQCISAMVELIEKTPRAGIVGSKQLSPTTGRVRHIGMAFGRYSHRHIFGGLPTDHPLCGKTRPMQIVSGATAAMTRRVLADIGPLDEDFYNTSENTDHCLKAYALGYVNYTCAESVAYHWVSQSGPARFARTNEDAALFWTRWGNTRIVDLGIFIDEALDHVLEGDPKLTDYAFEPLSLCRSNDEAILLECVERRWSGASARTHKTRFFNSPREMAWLPMEMPHRAMMNPSPYIYLVDRINQLSENRLWFETRARIVSTELVMDTKAVVLTTNELLALYGEPLQ